MLINALYNIIDRIFVGRSVGSLGIAGITVNFPIMLIAMGFMMLVSIGGNALVSIKLGEGKKNEAEHIMGNSFSLLILISLILTILGYVVMTPMLVSFGTSASVLPYAKVYLKIILLGTVFSGISFGMNYFIISDGNPRIAMISMLLGAALNTILCYVFVNIFGMGIEGSALATVIAQAVSSLWVLNYFFSGKSHLKIKRKYLRINKDIALKIFTIGFAPFAFQLTESFVNVILNKSLISYGSDIALSGMGIVTSISTLIVMPIFGINQGVQPIIGFNYGAEKFDRVKEALWLAIFSATAIVVGGFIAVEIFPYQIVSLFDKDNAPLIEFTTYALRVFLLFLPVVGFSIVSSSYFQAVGKARHAAFLSLSRQLIFLIPLVLILPMFFNLKGVILAGPVSDICTSIITGIMIYRELKYLDEKQNENIHIQPQME